MANAFYILNEWITDYKLSGNDLLIFARLASFTTNVGGYNGSIEWLGHSVGTAKRTTIDIIARLENRGLIERGGGMIKCVFQPLSRGEKSALNGAEIAPKSAKSAGAEIAPKSAKSAKKSAESAPKYNKEIYTPLKGGVSIIERGAQNTTDTTTEFLFKSLESKISSKQDHDCIAKLASAMTLEQAEVFVDYCNERKTTLHLGAITQLQDELLRKACEWDAQGRPRKAQKQPEITPQPQPQMLPQQEMPEFGAKDAEYVSIYEWREQIADCIAKHPKTAKKSWERQQDIKMEVYTQFSTPCDMQLITNYIEEL